MLHISKNPSSVLSDTAFYEEVQEHTELARYMDFTYRKDSILNCMLLLQNTVSGFLMIFSVVLFVICLIMIRHSLTLVIEQEKSDMEILTVFLSVIGHMGAWLGPNGEGLMNSFNVAEHDLGVQPLNQTIPMDEIERVINWYSPVVE